jgi:hypothetical protein
MPKILLTEEEKKVSYLRKLELQKIWKQNNKEKQKQYSKNHKAKYPNSSKLKQDRFKKNNPGRQSMLYRKYMLKRYNLTLEDYEKMLKEQNECCAICKNHCSLSQRSLHVDHCHSTGKVRGLLCSKCNKGLGMYLDNTLFLENAIKYLNKFKN